MMDKSIKDKWVKALRSGEYEQGRGKLCAGGAYCCLGVLADQQNWFTDKTGRLWTVGFFLGTLPHNLLTKAGLVNEDADRLIHMNDHDHKSFDQIATYIEENL